MKGGFHSWYNQSFTVCLGYPIALAGGGSKGCGNLKEIAVVNLPDKYEMVHSRTEVVRYIPERVLSRPGDFYFRKGPYQAGRDPIWCGWPHFRTMHAHSISD